MSDIFIYQIAMVTLVGVPKTGFPLRWGNCFSARLGPEDLAPAVKIINFNYENLEELLRRRTITWPIRIVYLDVPRKVALIEDPRVPDGWYQTKYCSICTPRDLLPADQKEP
jgi:hypothetical protein